MERQYGINFGETVWRRIRYGFYIKNYFEKKKNKEILKKTRLKHNNKIKEPLVSVTIPTYNRAKLLTERQYPLF